MSPHRVASAAHALRAASAQGVVGDRLFMFDLATLVPMLLASFMLVVLVAAQRALSISADYAL